MIAVPDAIVHPRTVSVTITSRHANETGQEGNVIRQNERASMIRKRRPGRTRPEKIHSPVVIVLQHAHPANPAVVTARRPDESTPIASTLPRRGVVVAVVVVVVAVLVGGRPPPARRAERRDGGGVFRRALARVTFGRRVDRGCQEAASPEPPPPPPPPPPIPRGGDVGVADVVAAPACGATTDGVDGLQPLVVVVVVAVDHDEARAQERAHQVPAQYVRYEEDYERRVGDVPAAAPRMRKRRTEMLVVVGTDEKFVVFVLSSAVVVVAMVVGGAPSTDDDLPSERREVRERARERHGHA